MSKDVKSKILLAATLVATLLFSIFNVAIAFAMMRVLDLATNVAEQELFLRTIAFVLIVLVGLSVMLYVQQYLKSQYIKRRTLTYGNRLFQAIIDKGILKINAKNSGEYISALTDDMKILEGKISSQISLFGSAATFLLALIALLRINFQLALLTITMGALLMLVPKVMQNILSTEQKKYSDIQKRFMAQTNDLLSGFEVIKTYQVTDKSNYTFSVINKMVELSKFRYLKKENMANSISTMLAYCSQLIIVLAGCYFVYQEKMSFGAIIAVGELTGFVISPIVQMTGAMHQIGAAQKVIRMLHEMINSEPESDGAFTKENFEQNVCLENITFSFGDRIVLENISLRFEKGKKYVIVGESGSGKSTLLNLMCKKISGYHGNIRIDEMNLRDIRLDSLLQLITIAHQDVFLFNTDIEENIKMFGEYERCDFESSIQKSGLSEKINSLEEKEKFSVGENGSNLSGGEKQRIAIARAVIRKTPILMLDEITSSLDNITAYQVENTILGLDATIINITHRLNPNILSRYDEIIVLKKGKVMERGSFDELMDNKDEFHRLYSLAR